VGPKFEFVTGLCHSGLVESQLRLMNRVAVLHRFTGDGDGAAFPR
jgi:hypothetical protein